MRTSLIFHWDPDKPNWLQFKQFFSQLVAGQYIIKPYSPPRNLEQNKLYWILLTWVQLETGNAKEYLHEMMKKKFLAWSRKRVKLNGKITYERLYGSTKKLNKKQFSEYFSKCELFFLENWVAPLPPHDSVEFQSLLDSSPYYTSK